MDNEKRNLIGVVMTDLYEKFGPRIVVAGVCNVEIATSFSNEHGYEYEKLKNFYSNSIPMFRCDCEELESAFRYIVEYLGLTKSGLTDKFVDFDIFEIDDIPCDKGYMMTVVGPQKNPDVIEKRFNRRSLGIHYMYETLSNLSKLISPYTSTSDKSSIEIKGLKLIDMESGNCTKFLSDIASYNFDCDWDYSMHKAKQELSIINTSTLDFDKKFDELFVQYVFALKLAINWKREIVDDVVMKLSHNDSLTYITLEELLFSAGDSLPEYLLKVGYCRQEGECNE